MVNNSMKYNKPLVLFIALVSILQGCIPAVNLKMKIPELKAKSPLGDVKPLTIVVGEFEDERPIPDRYKDSIGFAYYPASHPVILNKNKKVTDVVFEAISSELKRSGHNVINSVNGNKDADLIIKGTVSKYQFMLVPLMGWTQKFTGIVEAKLLYLVKGSNKTVLKTYSGHFTKEGIIRLPPKDIKEYMETALLNMIEDFGSDPEILDTLKELEKSKYKM